MTWEPKQKAPVSLAARTVLPMVVFVVVAVAAAAAAAAVVPRVGAVVVVVDAFAPPPLPSLSSSSSSSRRSVVGGGNGRGAGSAAPSDRVADVPSFSRVVVAVAASSSSRVGAPDDDDDNGGSTTDTSSRGRGRRRRRAAAAAEAALRPIWRSIRRKAKPISFAFLTAASASLSLSPGGVPPSSSLLRPPIARASAPLALPPAISRVDPMEAALADAAERRSKADTAEFVAHQKELTRIEAEEGEEARMRYEKEYESAQIRKKERRDADLDKLKRDLLDDGLCPYVDPEGVRRVTLFEHGVDLARVEGTVQFFDSLEDPKRVEEYRGNNRFIVKCLVDDLKKKGEDPLPYFEKNREKTENILDLDERSAKLVAEKYRENLRLYGTVHKPKDGTAAASASDAAAASSRGKDDDEDEMKMAEEELKEAKAEAKAKAAAERARKKEEAAKARAAKAKAKEEEKAARVAAKTAEKERKRLAKEEAKAKAALAAKEANRKAADDAEVAATAGMEMTAAAGRDAVTPSSAIATAERSAEEGKDADADADATPGSPVLESAVRHKKVAKKTHGLPDNVPIVPVASAVVALTGGGGFAFKQYKEKEAADEEERQRRFKLLMGEEGEESEEQEDEGGGGDEVEGGDSSTAATAADDATETDATDDDAPPSASSSSPTTTSATTSPSPAVAVPPPPPAAKAPKVKKRRRFFGKPASGRETDLSALLAPGASAPEFASLLARLLTYGAPGRFPSVEALPGGMPLETYDNVTARELLVSSRSEAGMTNEESAEVFASVVNCMVVDIVDLASSAMDVKGKGEDKGDADTVKALNVVMDFLDHAAGLYDAVAEGVVITPVTYGGTLGKSKLERMFGIYAASSVFSLDVANGGNAQDRVDTLQSVFGISDKKAEGLMQKAMMKNLMNMMKDGGEGGEGGAGMEGMAEMMAAMGGGAEGMEGLGGFPGMMGGDDGGEEPSPEEVKQSLKMMKEMLDSGAVSKEDIDVVRQQFKEAYGSGMDDLIAEAEREGGELSPDERELLDLMKSIFED